MGSVYAANTLGAIVGALVVSLVLVPWIGTQKTQRVLLWAALAAASWFCFRMCARSKSHGRGGRRSPLRVMLAAWLSVRTSRRFPAN